MTGLDADDVPQLLLAAAAIVLAVWCAMLARRLRRLNDLETGLGGAIAVMTAEVARLEATLGHARADASRAGEALGEAVRQAQAERARWAVQARFTSDAPPPAQRMRRRRSTEAGDAEA